MADTDTAPGEHLSKEARRRDFLVFSTYSAFAIGSVGALWPFLHSMNPAADVLALASTEVDLSPIEEGQRITITWRGKPVFIEHRSSARIAKAREDDKADLIDPELDQKRFANEKWLVLVGVCTHLGCVPLGQKQGDPLGDFGGWFCPCHGSHYDVSGRIRKGPAPRNLVVPPYQFISETSIRIG